MRLLENIYHTDNATDEEIIANFTIRKQEFNTIINALGKQEKKGLQNFLLIGKRGMGKSTLLRRIDIELQKQEYKQNIITIRLGGEGYRISKLYKLWEQVIDILTLETPMLKETKKNIESSKEYEQNLILIISEYLATANKTLLLLIDNFDTLIKNFTTKEQHILRETLIQYPIQIIGNTLFYEESFFSYNQPFYDFFKIIKLKNLSKEESIEFINNILEKEKKNGITINQNKKLSTISTLRILSGGVPRTIVFLLSVLFDDSVETTIDHLKKLNELVTPLYQDRMNQLSAQQREIIWAMAMIWDKTGVKEIAQITRMESKNVSAQLKVLEQNGYVAKAEIEGRNNYYMIDERYFNIWLLMSEGTVYDGKRVLWLTKSLDMLFDETELTQYAIKCIGNFKKEENKFLFAQAILQSQKLESSTKLELLESYGYETELNSENKNWLIQQKEKLQNEGLQKVEITNQEKNIETLKLQLEKQIENGVADATFKLGLFYHTEVKDVTKAEQYYLMAIEKGDVNAMNNLAILYHNELLDFSKAEKYYIMAIEKGHINAIHNLAHYYRSKKKDYEKAEKYYLISASKGNTEAFNELGILYSTEIKDITKAKQYYYMAIEKGNNKAISNLGLLYKKEYKDYTKAEKYFMLAIEKGDIKAINNLAYLYKTELKDYKKAEQFYLLAVSKGNIDAINELGILYSTVIKDVAKAEQKYLLAIEKGNVKAEFNLAILYKKEFKDFVKAEQYFLKAIEKKDIDAMYNLAVLYKYEIKNSTKAEQYFLMAIENGHVNSTLNLTINWFNENKNNKKALALFEKNLSFRVNIMQELIYAILLFWNNKIKEGVFIINNIKKENIDSFKLETLFFDILVFKQKNALYNLFNNNMWMKDVYKTFYYFLLSEMGEEKYKEFQKMPTELEEPVNIFKLELRRKREFYGVE